jgi:hypothetical protein
VAHVSAELYTVPPNSNSSIIQGYLESSNDGDIISFGSQSISLSILFINTVIAS